ncbi:unnamed protein product [Symbiodinium sp. CCMP2456]|nr:unnamed protein product [Symbiodinium sp. CCMP2456]
MSTASGTDSYQTVTDQSESDDDDPNTWGQKSQRRGCRCPPFCTASRVCHVCYICQLCLYLLVFPLWTKWLVTSPMPTRYWHQDFPDWPVISSAAGRSIALEAPARAIDMTPLPMDSRSCNYSCLSSVAASDTASVGFQVGLTLNDPELIKQKVYAVYPVLLASENFRDWWVAADKRHAHPTPFWRSRTAAEMGLYTYVSEACTKPPEKRTDMSEVLGGVYILACVTWSPDSFKKLSAATTLTMDEVGSFCSSAGGVCGWSCGAEVPSERLPGCVDHRIAMTSDSVAGLFVSDANFKGKVEIQECSQGKWDHGSCMTTPNNFQHWQCQECRYDPNPVGSDMDIGLDDSAERERIYTSLPRFKVMLTDVESPDGDVFNQPRIFLLSSTVKQTGIWKKLYMPDTGKFTLPEPVATPTKSPDDMEDEDGSTVTEAYTKQAMVLMEPSRLNIDPDWCFGQQGPLYLVACAVNASLYEDPNFENFTQGQRVAPPPFNDRCVAVSGRCGGACQSWDTEDLKSCTDDGYIVQSALVQHIPPQKNEEMAVWVFAFLLLLGFAVKVGVLCPGIFRSYKHYRRYDPELTQQLRYIVVAVTTKDEPPSIVLRSLIGAVSALPSDCACRYHVALLDEGHRAQQKVLWTKICEILQAIPSGSGFQSYEESVRQFFHVWVEETNKMTFEDLRRSFYGDKSQATLDKLSGEEVLKKLRKAWGWQRVSCTALESALASLKDELLAPGPHKNKSYLDDLVDWMPADENSIALRLHYLARASPPEDERTLKTQHVAPGTWYYEVPQGTGNDQWLACRSKAMQMLHGLEEVDTSKLQIALRPSRGKPGGLNFAANYFFVYAGRARNLYGDDRDLQPALFSVCDARHQFQTDFYHSTIPYFFDLYANLSRNVRFCQCPKYFPHVQDRADYLDNNDAQYFRLNCMIHNCCGGVSASSTNSTWLLNRKEPEEHDALIWELEKSRVRDRRTKRKHKEYIEFLTFPENCAAEDAALSLKQMVGGNRSHFISRRLSYGLALTPEEHLIAVQKSIQANFVLSLQSFFRCQSGLVSLWTTFLAFACFLTSLFWLVTKADLEWEVVNWGWLPKDAYRTVMQPVRSWSQDAAEVLNRFVGYDEEWLQSFIVITLQIAVWVASLGAWLLLIAVVTQTCKVIQRCCLNCGSIWPDEMRWWGRLLILVSNLSHFLWCWVPFFWIGFNFYNVFSGRDFHYPPLLMFVFTLLLQVLNWGLIGASCMRHSLEASMEANEVAMLTIDNIWRSTQRYYITAPLVIYSMVEGLQDLMNFQLYGQDVTVNEASGKIAVHLVKYWTLLLEILAIAAWICFYNVKPTQDEGGLSSLIIVTVIALDVLHPCAYLWVGETKMTPAKANSLSWYQALTTWEWWERLIHDLVLNELVTGVLKWLGPAWMIAMPLLTLLMPYIGVNQAFMLVATVQNR